MQTMYVGIVLLVAMSCKPIAKQEPVGREQSMVATLSRLITSGELSKARRLVRKFIRKGDYLSVNSAIRKSVDDERYHFMVRRLIKDYRVQIPKNEIAVKVTKVSNSTDVKQLVERLVSLRSTLDFTCTEFKTLDTMIGATPRIKNVVGEPGHQRGLRGHFYLQSSDRLKQEFADWSEPLLKQVEDAIRAFYRRGDVPLSDTVTLGQSIRGNVRVEWEAIKKTLDTYKGIVIVP